MASVTITIEPCTVADGPAIGQMNVKAFWTDLTWKTMWPGKTREYMASQASLRMSAALLDNRSHKRHLKAVDSTTGAIIGYARWVLPDTGDSNVAIDTMWADAKIPEVSEEVAKQAERDSASAEWTPDSASDALDPAWIEMRDKLYDKNRYACEL
jgi:hypothetical protein